MLYISLDHAIATADASLATPDPGVGLHMGAWTPS